MTDDAKSAGSAIGMEIEESSAVGETFEEAAAKIDPVTALQDSIGT